MTVIRYSQLPHDAAPPATNVVATDGTTTTYSTLTELVDAGRPFATQAEAEAGVSTTTGMNPLRTAQEIAALGATLFATAGALAAVRVPPGGSVNQVLAKASATDNDAVWSDVVTAAAITANTMLIDNAAGTLREAKPFEDIRASVSLAPHVASVTFLKALDTTKETVAYVKLNNLWKRYTWQTGNFTARVAADTNGYMWAKANAIADSAGAWVFSPGANLATFKDFGAVGDGTTDDTAALQLAMVAHTYGVGLAGDGPYTTYRLASTGTGTSGGVILPAVVDIDFRGSAIKPVGTNRGLSRGLAGPTPVVTKALGVGNPGPVQGSRTITVPTNTGLVVGQIVYFYNADTAYSATGIWPPEFNVIESIVGTTITMQRSFSITYPLTGTSDISMAALTASDYGDRCRLVGLVLDGSAATAGSAFGQLLHVGAYKSAQIEVSLKDLTAGGDIRPVQLWHVLQAHIDFESRNVKSIYDALDLDFCGQVTSSNIRIEARAFNVDFRRCDKVAITNIICDGSRHSDADNATTAVADSHRGLKPIGCGWVSIDNVIVNDLITGFWLNGSWRGKIGKIIAVNCAYAIGGVYTNSAVNFDVGGTNYIGDFYTIDSIHVENCGGIAVSNQGTGSAKNITIGNLVVKSCQGYALYNGGGDNIKVLSGHIEDWDLAATTSANCAIYSPVGGTFDNITYKHTITTTKPLFSASMGSTGGTHRFGNGIIGLTANPMFPSSKVVRERVTGTIASGATSVVVNHNLVITGVLSHVKSITQLNATTNNAGMLRVTAIGATTVTIACHADPGVSGLNFAVELDCDKFVV